MKVWQKEDDFNKINAKKRMVELDVFAKKNIKIDYRRPRLTEDDNLKDFQRQVLYELKSEMVHSRKEKPGLF